MEIVHVSPLYDCLAERTRTNGDQCRRASILSIRHQLLGSVPLYLPLKNRARLRAFVFRAILSRWASSCDSAESVRPTMHKLSEGYRLTEYRSTGSLLSCTKFNFIPEMIDVCVVFSSRFSTRSTPRCSAPRAVALLQRVLVRRLVPISYGLKL